MAAASRLAIQIARIAPIGAQKRLPLLAAFLYSYGYEMLVTQDWLFTGPLRSRLRRRRDQGVERNEAFLRLLSQDMLAIKPSHFRVFRVRFDFCIAGPELFLAGVLGNAQLVERVVGRGHYMLLVKQERVLRIAHTDLLAAGKDFVPAMLLVPFGEGRGHVHFFDDVAPAHAGVVSAEGNLAFLGGVRNDALLGAAEVVVEEVL